MFRYFIRNRSFWLKVLLMTITLLICLGYIFKFKVNGEALPDQALFATLVTVLGLLFVFNTEIINKINLEEKRPVLKLKIESLNLIISNTGLLDAKNLIIYSYYKNSNSLGVFSDLIGCQIAICNDCSVEIEVDNEKDILIIYQNAFTNKPYLKILSVKSGNLSDSSNFELNLIQQFISKFYHPDSYPKNIALVFRDYIQKWMYGDLKKNT